MYTLKSNSPYTFCIFTAMSTSPQGFSPFPKLATSRLELRQLDKKDIPSIFFLRSDSVVNQYIKRIPLKEHQEAEAFINRINTGIEEQTILYWAIGMKDSLSLIGTICLWNFNETYSEAEMGYELHPDYQGEGIMNEAMNSVLNYANQTLRLTAVEAFTHRDNPASTRLLNRNHFVLQPDRKDPDVPTNAIYRRIL